jgi:LmbE family N-acetylglucosaminyl deacetylase
MLALGSFLGLAFLLLAVGTATQLTWIRRHVRRPGAVVATISAVSLFGLPLSVTVALADDDAVWPQYAAGVAVFALIGVTVLLLAMRHAQVPGIRPRRVLVVGAHPDDLELACGGSLARFADRGHEVLALVMSSGENGGDRGARAQEALAGAQALDLAGVSVQDFTDTLMATELDEMVKRIELAVDLFKPDVILTHSAHDQHQDHHAVHLATLRAGRRSPTILCFESPSVTSEFQPSFFVDISDYVDAKVSAVQQHRDQLGKPYMGADLLRGAAVFRGAQARTGHAEGFEIVRALSTGVGEL